MTELEVTGIHMTEDELRRLPVTMRLEVAGRAWGLGRTKSFELARTGQFPCEVLKIGRQSVVTKAALLRSLGHPADLPDPTA